MADRPSKEQWRTRVEHFLESDMSVHQWCAANRISTSAMFRRLNAFADEEPELFGGAQNIADRSQSGWVGKTRESMRAANANGKPYSATYLRTINNQLNAIFNHAERYYDLTGNPCRKVTKMGSKKGGEMNFWTKQEYLRFSEAIMDKPLSFYAFEVLYWTGIRRGELLALTPSDFIFETSELSITKS